MEIYETDVYKYHEARAFMEWLDKNIGTETQLNDHGEGDFTITVFDLNPGEVVQIRKYENQGV